MKLLNTLQTYYIAAQDITLYVNSKFCVTSVVHVSNRPEFIVTDITDKEIYFTRYDQKDDNIQHAEHGCTTWTNLTILE